VSAIGALLDTPLAAYLDCEHGAMAHDDGEDHLIEQLRAGDPGELRGGRP
jgi:hypothetical protein